MLGNVKPVAPLRQLRKVYLHQNVNIVVGSQNVKDEDKMTPFQRKLFDELSNEIKKLEEQKKSIETILYYLYEEQKTQASKIMDEFGKP